MSNATPTTQTGAATMFLIAADTLPASIPSDSVLGEMYRHAIRHLQTACMNYNNGRYGDSLVALKLALEVFEMMSLVVRVSADTVASAADLPFVGAWRWVDALHYVVRRQFEDAYHACRIN